MPGHVLGQIEQMRKYHLCNRIGAISRHIGHRDIVILRCINIDNVVTCGEHTDIFELWQAVHDFPRQHDFVGQ